MRGLELRSQWEEGCPGENDIVLGSKPSGQMKRLVNFSQASHKDRGGSKFTHHEKIVRIEALVSLAP